MASSANEPTNLQASVADGVISAMNQFVTFTSGGQPYGIDIMAVREIRSWSPTTPLPGKPAYSRGVLEIRGSVIEVFDLSQLLGGPATETQRGNVVLVIALGKENIGLQVETVSDIVFAQPGDFRTVPSVGQIPGLEGKVSSLIEQEDRLVAILDPSRLLH